MKFKNYIETESGIKDTSTSPGTAGQVLSSTVTGTSWIDPDTLEAAASKLVVISCKNVSGVQILKGTPVYQSGTVGATDVIEVEPADATISTGYLPAIGILQTTLNNNGAGNVVITGEFLNYSTSGIPSNNPGGVPITGDTVYLAAGGGLTCIKPTGAGNAIQNLGLIGKVSGGNAGSITVSSIMRANDVPNLPTGRIWVGDGNTIVSDTVYVDEPNGRVGIGTTSPLGAIQIGDGTAASPSTNQILVLSNTATTGGNSNLYLATGASGTSTIGMGSTQFSPTNTAGKITYTDLSDTFSFNTNFSTKMSIIGNGNVGIGTTAPSSKLHVVASLYGPIDYFYRCAILGVNDSTNTFYANSIGVAGRVKTSNGIAIYGEAQGGGWGGYFDGKGFFSNNVGIGTTFPSEKLEVNGTVKATASTDAYKGYIKQTIATIANEKADNADYNLIPYNTLTTVSSDQYYNRMVAAYDGRIKKVYIRNTGGTPTADTVNFKKQINNTTAATAYSATVANAGSAGMSAVYNFADNDFTFNEGDTFGILYQTVNSVGGARKMAGVAINVIVEYNIT